MTMFLSFARKIQQAGKSSFSAPQELWAVRSLYFLYFAAFGIFATFINIYYRSIGLSGLQIGLVNTIAPFIGIWSGPIWGMLSDRFGKAKLLLLIAGIGSILGVLGLSSARIFIWILPLAGVYYLFNSPLLPLIDSQTLHFLGKHPDHYGVQRVWGSIGYILTTMIAGRIIENTGLHWLFFGYSFLMVFFLIAISRVPSAKAHLNPAVWKGVAFLFRNPAWIFFSISFVLQSITMNGMNNFLGVYIREMGGSDALVGTLNSLAAISEVPVMVASAWLLSRFGAKKMLLIAFGFYAFRMLCYGFLPSPQWALPLSLFHGVTFGFSWIGSVAYAGSLAPSDLKATAQGFLGAGMNLASVLGAPFSGYLFDLIGPAALFRVFVVFDLVALFLLLVGAREQHTS